MSNRKAIFLIIILALAGSVWGAPRRVSMKDVMTPPADSIDRENLRIWVPVERKSDCRMTINILNQAGDTVRHLIDAMIPQGYHNFYWDKRTDSGEYVYSGDYKYKIEDCVTSDSGKVTVSYKENDIKIDLKAFSFETTLKPEMDSVHLELRVFNDTDSLIAVPLDTVLGNGNYEFDLKKTAQIPKGKYYEVLYLNGAKFSESEMFEIKR